LEWSCLLTGLKESAGSLRQQRFPYGKAQRALEERGSLRETSSSEALRVLREKKRTRGLFFRFPRRESFSSFPDGKLLQKVYQEGKLQELSQGELQKRPTALVA
jgi:hypothetical protein